MTIEERILCIKQINPDARFVIYQDADEQHVKYDDAHTGAKPTLEECEAILPQIKAVVSRPQVIASIQEILDGKAREYEFDNFDSALKWAGCSDAEMNAYATALRDWGATVWRFAKDEWKKQAAGTPTYLTIEAFLAALPVFMM